MTKDFVAETGLELIIVLILHKKRGFVLHNLSVSVQLQGKVCIFAADFDK